MLYFGLIALREEPETPVINNEWGGLVEEVTDRNNYYMVKNCVSKFYKYYATMFNTKEEEDINKTYILLDEKYINFKGITQENMLTILPRMGDVVINNITNMWSSKQSETITIYIVEGLLREELTNEILNFQIMIQEDSENGTFSVMLQDYVQEKHKDLKIGDYLKIEALNSLKSDRYNLYVAEEITDVTHAKTLFNDYKEKILYNPELVYEILDKEYSSVKFGTLGKFKEFAESNKVQNEKMQIKQYQKTEDDNYVQYVCVDQNGRYYIFREYQIMNYRLVLDTYTIDLPEFLEKYNKADTVEKVGYNIQKCLDAINNNDYSYVYDKLDFEFKAINYVTLDAFEREIKSKLFNNNKVKTVLGKNEGDTYIYQLTITDVEDDTKERDMTVIMQLKQGTDFVMSMSFGK